MPLTHRAYLLSVLPRGCTVHVIKRSQSDEGMQVDVYRIEPLDSNPVQSLTHWLNRHIAGLLELDIPEEEHILLAGTGTDHRSDLVGWLAKELYGSDDALECEKL